MNITCFDNQNLLEIPNEFLCPISMEIMQDPVIILDGSSFERSCLMSIENPISPLTRQPIDLNSLIPNRALKEIIQNFIKGFKNPLVISNSTHKYNDYLFELNKKDNNILIKIQNMNTSRIYEGIITENNISIKPLSKFNLMLTRALTFENNYTITFTPLVIDNNEILNICIIFNNDVIDIEQSFNVKEVYISELDKQKYKIMSLENKIKNENKDLIEKIKLLENKNKELFEETRILKDEIGEINELLQEKQEIEDKQEIFNQIVKKLYWDAGGYGYKTPTFTRVIKCKLDLEMLPSCETGIIIYIDYFVELNKIKKDIINEEAIYENITFIKFLFYDVSKQTRFIDNIFSNKEIYYSILLQISNIMKKHFPNSKVECSGPLRFFEHIDNFLFISKDTQGNAIYMLK